MTAVSSAIQQERALTAVRECVSPSLMPFLFRFVRPGEGPTASHFTQDSLPRTAGQICKLSALLLQACWYVLKGKNQQAEIPPEVDHILLQVWAGNHRFTEGLALSVLQEAAVAPIDSFLHSLIGAPHVIVKWRNLLNCKALRYKEFLNELQRHDIYQMFVDLIESLPILKRVSFADDHFHLPGGIVSSFPYVYQPAHRAQALYLSGFENVDSQPTVVFEDPFSDYMEDIRFNQGSKELEQFSVMREVLGLHTVKPGMLYLFGPGYLHIRNLGRAVAASPPRILEELWKWSKQQEDEVPHRPEDLVTLLLAERGPTEVLEHILRKNQDMFETYLKFLSHRGEMDSVEYRQLYLDELARKEHSIQDYLDLDPTLKDNVVERMQIETQCWCVLSAAGLPTVPGHEYVESIGTRLHMLQRLSREFRLANLKTTAVNIGQLTERTLRFLICFYSGLLEYHKSHANDASEYDRHEAWMTAKARDEFARVYKLPAGALMNRFKELCGTMYNKEAMTILLGRRAIYNANKDELESLTGWTETLNRIKHGMSPPLTEREGAEFVNRVIRFFKFLRDGRVGADETIPRIDREPIYPQVVSFREAHRKRDGLVIYNYEIHSTDGKEEREPIKILTPREYAPNAQYYCIQVKDKSTRDWWLDPFLIPCSRFDATFREDPSKRPLSVPARGPNG